MKCPKCGAQVPEGSKFCNACGAKMGAGGSSSSGSSPSASGSSSSGCGSVLLLVIVIVAAMGLFKIGPFAPSSQGSGDLASSDDQAAVVELDTDIPDPSFRSYLKDTADLDSDGSLSQDEVDAVTQIGSTEGDDGLSGRGVSSLDGIEHFTNLTTLVCVNNSITSLDLSQNVNLQQVDCSNNQLTVLELPACSTLTTLHCAGNQLSGLDLSPCPQLTDVQVDGTTQIEGSTFEDSAARTAIEDMALIYSVAATPDATSGTPQGEQLRAAGQDSQLDTMLIFDTVYPEVFQGRANLSCTDITYDLSYEIPDVGGMYFVPEETVRKIIASFYGSCPDDLSYIGNNAVYREGTGWTVTAATGPFVRTIESDSWASVGDLVTCDVTVTYTDGLDAPVAYRYRVWAVRDASSAFGYHLTSIYALGEPSAASGDDAASLGDSATASSSSSAYAAGSSGIQDYYAFTYMELSSLGLIPEGSKMAVEEETDDMLRVRVYEDHPDHIVTLGWYTLDKDALVVTDDMTGEVL